ncbi:MAG: RIP metalloprotease RseP [Lachnospiraceae bacterium]|nr:RIP metalloprotease RseP [Lachnospiraceae bacterium]
MSAAGIIIGILVIGLIVFVHEFGHFLIARKNGVNVPEFWIGFGPKLLSFRRGGTEFSLRPILFGGACVFDRIDTEEDEEDEEEEGRADAGRYGAARNGQSSSFVRLPMDGLLKEQSPWVRLQVLFAGPFFNLLLGFFCALIVIGAAGIDLPRIDAVTEGYPAEEAGLESGDLITRIDGERMFTFRDLQLFMSEHAGEPLTVVYERGGEEYETVFAPRWNEEAQTYYLGISVSMQRAPAESAAQALRYSAHEVVYWMKYTVSALRDLVTGRIPVSSLSGPVGVVSAVSDVVEESSNDGAWYVFLNLVNIILILSVDIGIMNLLPIPGLDGGRILLVLVELVRGRRLPEKGEYAVTLAGVVLLFLLMIFVFFKDVAGVFGLF